MKRVKQIPHTLEEIRNSIRREISTVASEELRRVNKNVFRRHTKSIRAGQQKFPHLL
jgi:hypothetical protein